MSSGDREIFARLIGSRRIWAVAAIHAEVDRLRDLHDILQQRFKSGDRLVYLGNMVGRNARVIETMDELLLFRRALMAQFMLFPGDIVYLRGAQEEMWQKMMQLHLAQSPAQVIEWMLSQGAGETLDAYGGNRDDARARCRDGATALARWTGQMREAVRARPGHEQLLSSVYRAALTTNGHGADGALLFVNACLDVSKPLTRQADTFWWGTANFDAIDKPYGNMQRIIRGYDAQRDGVRVGKVTATIDGGCGQGGPLVAACFDPEGEALDWIEA